MGVVYKARDPLLDRVVAVKTIMSPAGSGKRVRAAYIERFQREAKAAAKMQHPSIVTIFDVGVDNGAPFMVLEYLPGESLADRLDRVRLPLGKGIQIGLDLANALAFAHRQRIVHRDVKPANVLHAGENRWKLADFGIARLPDSDLTQIGIFMGTPGYSPPEAIRHGQYTPQADVFAWGAVLYELLSGRIPYEGPDTRTTNSYVLKGTAPLIREYDPSIPEPLADVIMRALSPSVDERFKEGADAEDALRQAWDECLNSSLVPTSCLTGEEVPHERVGPEMHIAKVPKPRPAAPPAPPPAQAPGDKPVLVIESRSSNISEDAPTQLLIRDSISGPDDRADSPSYLGIATGERLDQSERTDKIEQPAPLERGNHLDPTSGMVTRPYFKAAQTTLTTRPVYDRRIWLIGGAIVAILAIIAVVLVISL
jgi:serine/threonine-protein kinase